MRQILKKTSRTFFVFCLLFVNHSFAQYNWMNYDTSNSGIEYNSIFCLTSDRTGNVWLGFTVGSFSPYQLIKYDGINWMTYDTSNSGLPYDMVRTLGVDTNNNVWIGTQSSGIVKYDGINWTLYNTSNSGIISNNISSITIDKLNRVWLGSNQWGLTIYDGVSWIVHNQSNWAMPNNCINTVAFDDSNRVWFGFDCNGGIAVLNLTDSSWVYYNTGNSNLPSNYISSITKDTSGNMWVGFALQFSGVAKFDGTSWITYSPFQSSGTWVSYNAMVFDSNNNLWVGTRSEELYKYDGTNWVQYGNPLPNIGNASLNYPININVNNRLWYGTETTGLWTADLNVGMNEPLPNNGVSIYPNPVSDNLTIEISSYFPEKKYLNIYNVLGEKILQTEFFPQKCSINLSGLRSGIYFVEIQNGKSAIRKRIIKL